MSDKTTKAKVKVRWPHAYCLKDGGVYYIFGNPKRDDYDRKKFIKNGRKFVGNDMLSCGSTPKEAWSSVEGIRMTDTVSVAVAKLRAEITQLLADRKELQERIVELERRLRIPFGKLPCAQCGGPHDFDTSVPSVVWNRVIRAQRLPEYLCTTCIVREFAKRGEGFTATLWSEEFNGVPIEVGVNTARANVAAEISDENTSLRQQVKELQGELLEHGAELGRADNDIVGLRQQLTAAKDEVGKVWDAAIKAALDVRHAIEAESGDAISGTSEMGSYNNQYKGANRVQRALEAAARSQAQDGRIPPLQGRCEVCELLESSPSHGAGMCVCTERGQCHCRFE